jgi:soluble lytic murein transglycosylase-like protein
MSLERLLRDILGLRDEQRRNGSDRRQVERGTLDRRRMDRRRRTLRGLLFGMFAVAVPGGHGVSSVASLSAPKTAETFVSVSEAYHPVPATIAYNDVIAEAAGLYGLDPNLIRAVIHAESAFNPFAVSRAGARGLMQLMPDVAEELNVFDPFDPRQNIFGGARYLKWLLDRHHGNIDLAVASYNAGPGAVDRYKGIPPYRETRNYVKTIRNFLKHSRRTAAD